MINKEEEEEKEDENQSLDSASDLIESQVTRGDTLESILGSEEPDGVCLSLCRHRRLLSPPLSLQKQPIH